MKFEQKEFLDLLQEYKSDETKKSRRNLSAIGFIIIGIGTLKIQITDVHVLGVDLSKSSEFLVLILAFLLLVYWFTMFLVSWFQDREIQNERTLILTSQITPIIEKFKVMDAEWQSFLAIPNHAPSSPPHEYAELKAYFNAYQAQQARIKRAAQYGNLIRKFEIVVPIGLAVVATLILLFQIFLALNHRI